MNWYEFIGIYSKPLIYRASIYRVLDLPCIGFTVYSVYRVFGLPCPILVLHIVSIMRKILST